MYIDTIWINDSRGFGGGNELPLHAMTVYCRTLLVVYIVKQR